MGPTAPAGGRRIREARAAARAVREGRPDPRDRDGDRAIAELVAEPYDDVDAAHEQLGELLAAFRERGDRRAVFLGIYVRMTAAMTERIRRGEFEDPEWVGEYLLAFANLYRAAVHDYETGSLASLADPWQLAFDAAEEGEALLLQDAALGVNAHINYDLALAIDRVGIGPDRRSRYTDHSAVTDVVAALVDRAQASLVERGADGVATVDDALGRVDERLTVLTIDECRDAAWRRAAGMRSRCRTRRRLARWFNDVTATGGAHLILSSRVSEAAHDTLAEFERSFEEIG